MARIKDLVNQRFGRLLVLKFVRTDEKYCSHWLCLCDCGIQKIIKSKNLKSGSTNSCGCLGDENRIKIMQESHTRGHQLSKTYTYKIWKNMRSRCNIPSSSGYYKYGAKGIKVCERWSNFELFLQDMGECPKNYSIERINPLGNYEPLNCKWIPLSEQRWNKTTSRFITFNGETKNLSQWAAITKIPRKTISNRIARGWPIEKALNFTN